MGCPQDLPGTQVIRVLDVIAVGPGLIAAGVGWTTAPRLLRVGLAFTGAATILFNGVNLIRCARSVHPQAPLALGDPFHAAQRRTFAGRRPGVGHDEARAPGAPLHLGPPAPPALRAAFQAAPWRSDHR